MELNTSLLSIGIGLKYKCVRKNEISRDPEKLNDYVVLKMKF